MTPRQTNVRHVRRASDIDELAFFRGALVWLPLSIALWALIAVALFGCATDGLRRYGNGPAVFITGDAGAIRAYCIPRMAALADNRGGSGAGGCSVWTGTTATIACAEGNGACIAHELRHVIQPDWRHE